MKVYIERDNRAVNENANTVAGLLEKLKINPVTVIVVKNGCLVTEDEKLSAKDKVKILSVVSGG